MDAAAPPPENPGMTENAVEKLLFATDQFWLDRRREEILEPDSPIVDPHHSASQSWRARTST